MGKRYRLACAVGIKQYAAARESAPGFSGVSA
jgi:hypothetical protein